jgi:hypothetical protein
MSVPELALVFFTLKSVDALACSFILGVALRLIVAGRLEDLDALRRVLCTAPFAAFVPLMAPFALFNVLVAALGVVTAARANMGAFEVFNHGVFPLLAAVFASLALNFTNSRAVSRTRRS